MMGAGDPLPRGLPWHRLWALCWVTCCWLLVAANARGAITTIQDLSQPASIARHLAIIDDPARTLRFNDVLELNDPLHATLNDSDMLVRTDTSRRYWFKTTLQLGDQVRTQRPMLVIPGFESQFYLFNLWIQDSAGNTQLMEAGYLRPYVYEHSQFGYYAFPLPDTGGPITLVGYVDNMTLGLPISMPVSIMSTDQLNIMKERKTSVMTAFYSVMTMILLYNLFLWASMRQALYGRYVAFLVLGTCVSAMLDGSFQRWCFPDSAAVDLVTGQTLVVLMCMAYLAFVKKALGDFRFSPSARLGYRGMLAAGVLLCVYFPLRGVSPYLSALSNAYVLISMVYVLIVILKALHNRVPLAGYYLLSELMPIAGGFVFLLQVHGAIPVDPWLQWSSHAGFALESLLLSLAVAAQTKMIYQEKEREQLQNRARTQFFATMSHEFRTPLTAVLGYTELALTPDISNEKRLDYLRTIAASADYMLHLINDTLDMSKIEAQKMAFEKSAFDLHGFCEEMHDYASILASKKHLQFQIEYVFPLPAQLVSDRTRLKQVLINLCSNAIKFTDSGSVRMRIAADATSGQIHFAVIDTGIGIRPDQIPQLFGAYAQTHDPAAHNVTGSGLGLYLSQLIARNLGGNIAVESAFGAGSTFTLSVAIGHNQQEPWVTAYTSLPAAHAGTVLQGQDHPEPVPSSGLQVLIVDDNSINLKLLSAILTRWGVQVITETNGLAAIASVIRYKPGLLLMDVDMPVMDGLTAMQHIRDLGLRVPAYAITGSVSDGMVQRCYSHGFDGHLAKPFQRHLIEAIVQKHMAN